MGNTPRILIAGYFGFGNAGDEAILASMIHHLGGSARITVVSGDPAGTAARYAVEAVSWVSPVELTEAARRCDAVLLGGGGIFHDYWGVNPGAMLSEQHWGLSYFLAPAFLAAVFGKPLMIYAAGVGPLLSEHGRSLTRVACEIASAITVRDEYSKTLLESLGVEGRQVRVTADPAFVLPLDADSATLPELPRLVVGVALRNWAIGVDQSFWEQQVASALDNFIEQHGGSAVFVPFQRSSQPAESDEYPSGRVLRLMRNKESARILPGADTPAAIASMLGECSVILGMRLHSLVFAIRKGRPAVALSYDPKISAFMERAGLQEFDVPVGAADAVRIGEALDRAVAGCSELQPKLAALGHDLAAAADENNRIARELPGSQPPARVLTPGLRSLLAHFVAFQTGERAELLKTRAELSSQLQAERSVGAEQAAQLENERARAARSEAALRDAESQLAAARAEAARAESEKRALEAELAEARASIEVAAARSEEDLRAAREAIRAAEDRAAEARRAAERATVRVNHLCRELDFASAALERARSLPPPVRPPDAEVERLRAQIARMEAKTAGGIAKRALQLGLDTVQALTPEFLRATVRKYYLSGFYYRIYPERRPVSPAAARPPTVISAGTATVSSGYAPFVEFKQKLYRDLPLDFGGLRADSEPGRVSVVLPVYNGAGFLAGSIESVLAQSYRNFELIIVDDGSKDNSAEVAERFAADDPRVRVIRQKNQKLPAALNTGFAQARGEFHTWTSHDNLMHPEQLSELVSFLRARPDIEMVYADEEIIDDDGQPLLGSDFCPGYQTPPGSNVICWPRDPGELNFVQNNYIGACFLYRSWAARAAGAYDTGKFGYEDYEYWMRMNALFRVSHLGKRQPLYKYRLHAASLSSNGEAEIARLVRDFMEIEAERLRFLTESFDITLAGRHSWFPEMADWYRKNGHNVFEVQDSSAESAYHHRVTRAFRKSLVVFGGGVEEADLVRWTDPEGRAVLALVAEEPVDLPRTVLARIDCAAATDAAWESVRGCRCALRSSKAVEVLYPLLAAANVRSFARARAGL